MKRSPTLVLSTQNWSILAKFAKKNPAKLAVFYWLFLVEVSPRNFPWNRPIFLRSCPWKSFENWLFCAKIPRNRPIHSANFDFFLLKSREIGRFFREFWLFPHENPAKSADFSANLPLKIPRNFAFFSAKYQRPCLRLNALSFQVLPILIYQYIWSQQIYYFNRLSICQ